MRLNQTTLYSSIKLNESAEPVPREIQILRVGKFKHPTYGDFEITTQMLMEMKANFDLRVRGVDVGFDYFHESDKEASGWPTDLLLKEASRELWAVVDWTPKAQKKLAERELRYFSPDFAFTWEDPETGVTFNNVLFGGGLTNRPFLKEMQAIVASEIKPKGNEMTELEKAQAALKEANEKIVKLSEDKVIMEKKMADIPAPSVEEKSEIEALKKVVAELQAQIAKAQAESGAMLAEKQKRTRPKF